jgi:hypothetical protein
MFATAKVQATAGFHITKKLENAVELQNTANAFAANAVATIVTVAAITSLGCICAAGKRQANDREKHHESEQSHAIHSKFSY